MRLTDVVGHGQTIPSKWLGFAWVMPQYDASRYILIPFNVPARWIRNAYYWLRWSSPDAYAIAVAEKESRSYERGYRHGYDDGLSDNGLSAIGKKNSAMFRRSDEMLGMQELAFHVINEKAQARYPDGFPPIQEAIDDMMAPIEGASALPPDETKSVPLARPHSAHTEEL